MTGPGGRAFVTARQDETSTEPQRRHRREEPSGPDRNSPAGGRAHPASSRRRRWALFGVTAAALVLPLVVLAVRLAAWTRPVHLPDDLALIDLHTRLALHWHQSLGPFDRFGWSHPGPSWYYLAAVAYRLLGAKASSAFVAAVVVNGLSVLGTLAVVRRRAGERAAALAALGVGLLVLALSFTGPASVTYSESPLGALASPWNATIVVLPLVLAMALAASFASGSRLSLLGFLLVSSFVVQTDLSTLPLVAVVLLVSLLVAAGRLAARRRGGPAAQPAGERAAGGPKAVALLLSGAALLVLAWLPPLLEEVGGHPGNMTLIWRFFTAPHTGTGYAASLWSVASADAVLWAGPRAVMSGPFFEESTRALLGLVATGLVVLAGLVVAWRRHQVFGGSLALLGAAGSLASVVAVTHVTGLLAGYLVLWEAAVPAVALSGLAVSLLGPGRPWRGVSKRLPAPWWAVSGGLLAVLSGALFYRAAAIPPLGAASNPTVSRLAQVVNSHLPPAGGPVFVGDNGLSLIGTEEFIGLVDELDTEGYRPRVSPFWRVQFGPAYLAPEGERRQVVLWPASGRATRLPGYAGTVGGIAVQVIGARPG